MKQNKVILLTTVHNDPILIGVDSIITVTKTEGGTKIYSRAAMATTCYVIQSVEEIYTLINK